jgi:hypothetical protein
MGLNLKPGDQIIWQRSFSFGSSHIEIVRVMSKDQYEYRFIFPEKGQETFFAIINSLSNDAKIIRKVDLQWE